ncbi:MAG: tetratricopeptide repeat protein [Colwellia sp.]
MSYFSKNNTGGSFASKGFSYQDACALLIAVKHLGTPGFKSIGIETNDDFCILTGSFKTLYQVKDKVISFSEISKNLSANSVLIGSSLNKNVETFCEYLSQFRNHQNSDESKEAKLLVEGNFDDILEKRGLPKIKDFEPSWSLEHIPRANLLESIAVRIQSWSGKQGMLVSIDDCLEKLFTKFSKARDTRGYIKNTDLEKIINSFSATFQITSSNHYSLPVPECHEVINSIGLSANNILDEFAKKIVEADDLLKKKDYEESYKIYSHLVTFVQSEEIYVCCASVCQMLNKKSEAIEYSQSALKLNPKSIGPRIILGTIYSDDGENILALDYLESAYLDDDENPFLLYNLGVLYIRLKKTDKAIQYLEKSIHFDQGQCEAYINLSICQFDSGIFWKSLTNIDRALALEPGQLNALSHKGEILRFFGDTLDAIELFNRCLAKDPNNFIALKGLALCNIYDGNMNGVAQLIKLHEKELNDSVLEKGLVFIDIGWLKTNWIKVLPYDSRYFKVVYNDIKILVPKPRLDMIGIGVIKEKDTFTPIIIKEFELDDDFYEVCKKLTNEKYYYSAGSISDKCSYCDIQLNFNGYSILGHAPKSETHGFERFKECYKDNFYLLLKSHSSGKVKKIILSEIEIIENEL